MKKIFDFPSQFINENCCYFDETSKTLFIAYNNIETKTVELRIIKQEEVTIGTSKSPRKDRDKGNSKPKSKVTTPQSKVEANKKGNEKESTTTKKMKKPKKKQVVLRPLVATLQYPKNIELLFKNCRCHYLFYHKLSNSVILMLKNPKLHETVEKMVNYRKQNKGKNNNKKVQKLVAKMELQSGLFENLFKGKNNKKNDDSDDEKSGSTLKLPDKSLSNLGRILTKIRIDFDNLEIGSMRCGLVNIPEDKCRIVAYDDARAAVIVDTKTVNYVDFEKICTSYEDIRKEVTMCDGDKEKVTKYRTTYSKTEFTTRSVRNWYGGGWRTQRVAKEIKTPYTEPKGPTYYSSWSTKQKRAERNYRVLRLNDMVDKWKNIF